MKQQTVILTVVLFLLLTSIYSMSDDGQNEPKVVKQKVSSVNLEQTEEAKSIDTVKDRLGIDTGMSKVQLVKFRDEFDQKASKLGIPKGKGKNGYNSHFKWKTNLNKYYELKKLGVDLGHYGKPNHATSHLEHSVYSDVVLVGEIYDWINVDDQEFYNSIYKVRVLEVLKGEEFILDEFNNNISLPSKNSKPKNGKYVTNSNSTEMRVGEKRLFFLKYKLGEEDRFASNSLSEKLIKDNSLYNRLGTRVVGDLKTEIEKIKKIIEINDFDNFYNRSYKTEVEK